MPRLRALALTCSSAAVLATSALAASSGRIVYNVTVNARLSGELHLVQGDQVVCRNPSRTLVVTLGTPNGFGEMRAAAQVVSAHWTVRLTVAQSTLSGHGLITCLRTRTRH